MKIIGIVLIVLGIIGFLLGGISFTRSEQVADVGPLEIEAKQEETIPITPWASGAAVVAGVALVALDARKKQSAG